MDTNRIERQESLATRVVSRYGAVALAMLAALAITTPVNAATHVYGCVLNNRQEVPPTASTALGGGQVVIDTDANTLTYRIAFTGTTSAETAAHIHGPADPGVNAGVMNGLPLGNPKAGVWNYLEAQEADILAGRTYVNIHTAMFGGGEVRGQIVPFNATLDGAQEVPPNGSAGAGWGVFTIDTSLNQLSYYIAFGGVGTAETAAHFHGPALIGTNAGVALGLPVGSPKVGVWNYLEAEESAILSGQMYVNVHTVGFPGGEIRGQVCPLVLPIDNLQEVPPNGSTGAGIALLCYNSPLYTLGYDIRLANLLTAETASHFHGMAPPGASAGVLTGLGVGTRKLGTWVYGAGSEAGLKAGLVYFNTHTMGLPGGELRGQLQGFPALWPAGLNDFVQALPFRLEANSPNPFRDATVIEFNLESAMAVEVGIFDPQGRRVRSLASQEGSAGQNRVVWDGRDDWGRPVASGTYGYVLQTPEGETARRLVLIR